MSRVTRPQRRRRHHEPASGRSGAEDLGGGSICSEAAARRPAWLAGEIISPQRLAAAAGSSLALKETCGGGLAEPSGQRDHLAYPPEYRHRASANDGSHPKLSCRTCGPIRLDSRPVNSAHTQISFSPSNLKWPSKQLRPAAPSYIHGSVAGADRAQTVAAALARGEMRVNLDGSAATEPSED